MDFLPSRITRPCSTRRVSEPELQQVANTTDPRAEKLRTKLAAEAREQERWMLKDQPKVLVVDDELYQSHLFLEALRDDGFQVTFAPTVDDALDLARAERFDVIALDIMMPPGEAFDSIETVGVMLLENCWPGNCVTSYLMPRSWL